MLRTRQYIVFFFLISFLLLLLIRLFSLQILDFDRFSGLAAVQHTRVMKIEPRRGSIYDRNSEPLAVNLDVPSIFSDPRGVEDPEGAADKLSTVLGIDRDELVKKLQKDGAFVWIKRRVSSETAEKVRALKLKGIHFLTESQRKYSNNSMASHIIGFAGVDNNGLEGLELLFNDELKGSPGWRHMLRDAKRRTVLYNEEESILPRNGNNLVLTIDSVIQYIVEDELKKMVTKFNASGASVVVMDPFSGRILAMASYPDYDLNNFSKTPKHALKNSALSDIFEPGSVFKIITASAALQEGVIGLEDKIKCENGEYRVGGRVLHDYHAYDELSFMDVIVNSSNIGTVKVAYMLGKDKLFEYIRSFGFGEKTGIDLSGEVRGISRKPSIWSRSDMTTIPIGQGIAVSSLQLACAVSVIANGGYLMRPFIVDRITSPEGGIYRQFGSLIRRRVLDDETCEKMKDVLARVVTDGTGRRVKSKLYELCGKTGTAQMVNPRGGYYKDKYYATFIGFAPRKNPAISIVVSAKDPHPVHFGGSVAGPAFKNIAERVLQYLGTGEVKT